MAEWRHTTASYHVGLGYAHDDPRRERYLAEGLEETEENYGSGAVLTLVERDDDNYHLVSSKLRGDRNIHTPSIDVDVPIEVIPSSHPGHHHLYFPTITLTWDKYEKLLQALAAAGIISPAYYSHSRKKQATMLRRPSVKKTKIRKNTQGLPAWWEEHSVEDIKF